LTDDNRERRLGKLEAATAVIQNDVTRIKQDTHEIIQHVKETNGRLSALETWQQRIVGIVAVVILALSVFGVYALDRLIG